MAAKTVTTRRQWRLENMPPEENVQEVDVGDGFVISCGISDGCFRDTVEDEPGITIAAYKNGNSWWGQTWGSLNEQWRLEKEAADAAAAAVADAAAARKKKQKQRQEQQKQNAASRLKMKGCKRAAGRENRAPSDAPSMPEENLPVHKKKRQYSEARAAARLLAKTFFATPILGTPDSDDESEDETIAEYDGSLLFIY
jgi:hypothetical protein